MNPHTPIGMSIRQARAADLARALADSRRDTLATFAVVEAALAGNGLAVPLSPELNPPLWELGHIGWFQAWWLGRNPQRGRGLRADPDAPRPPDAGDALYNSSQVPHDRRWQLALPDARATRATLQAQLQHTLGLLEALPAGAAASDDPLYFFRLALLHEDMHHEAALYMAQALGICIDDARWQPLPLPAPAAALAFEAGPWQLGHAGPGFAFDNERGAHTVVLPAFEIDAQVRRWADYLPFVEDGGYAQPRWWSVAGQAWLQQQGLAAPRYLRRDSTGWWMQRGGRWRALDPALPASHLTAYEAEAWCAWAGRRLPTEAEWERAAVERPEALAWGAVWEWTASPFAAYPGFVAHPYRDYSAPWFGSRPVLRGASAFTQPRLHHARYRNYFPAGRNDILAGLRSCAAR